MQTFLLLLGINLVGLFIIYFLVKREIKRSINPHDILSEIQSDINSVLTELNNATERDVTIIEEATERLKKVIEEADKRIRVLEQAGKKRSIDEYTALKPSVIPIQKKDPSPETKPTDNREKVLELFRQGIDASLIAHRLDIPLGEVELIIALGG